MLNTSCKWWLDDAIREAYALSDRRSTDPGVMAKNMPDKKQRLPGSEPGDRKHELPAQSEFSKGRPKKD